VEEYMKKKEQYKILKLNRKWYIKSEKKNYPKDLTIATQPPLLPL
jgi:ubiquitin